MKLVSGMARGSHLRDCTTMAQSTYNLTWQMLQETQEGYNYDEDPCRKNRAPKPSDGSAELYLFGAVPHPVDLSFTTDGLLDGENPPPPPTEDLLREVARCVQVKGDGISRVLLPHGCPVTLVLGNFSKHARVFVVTLPSHSNLELTSVVVLPMKVATIAVASSPFLEEKEYLDTGVFPACLHLAFQCALHPRVGAGSPARVIPSHLLKRIVNMSHKFSTQEDPSPGTTIPTRRKASSLPSLALYGELQASVYPAVGEDYFGTMGFSWRSGDITWPWRKDHPLVLTIRLVSSP
ncbi:hypothetical protein Pelo_12834 [Pelomyxa schiedti]|nr:hypothetical protein Pelo_12834 [Pelomyxa schiedti]